MAIMEVKLRRIDEKLFSLQEEVKTLLKALHGSESITDKIAVLDQQPRVIAGLEDLAGFSSFLSTLSPVCHYVAKALIAIGQGDLFAFSATEHPACKSRWQTLIGELVAIENFYEPIGGVIGYQCLVLELLSRKVYRKQAPFASLHPPTRS